MGRITGKEAEGLMAAYARVHAPEIKEDESKEVSSEEKLLEEELQDLSEEELQEILGSIRQAGSAIRDRLRAGGDAFKKGVEGGIDKAKQTVSNVKDKVKSSLQTKVQQGRDLVTGGTEKLKAGNQLKDRMAQKQETLKTQQASGENTGKTKAQILFLKNKRQQMNNPNQPKLSAKEKAQQMARERLAAKKNTVTGESYDQYDQIADLLISEGYADNMKDAQFIMSQPEFIEGFNHE
tara:strand:+ start:1152 stop:1862 length:711 start_codon:yes stop_codon:yes gene_type:complete